MMELLNAYAPIWPELALAVMAMGLLMVGVFARERAAADLVNSLSLAALAATALLVLFAAPEGALFGGAFVNDALARVMKILVLFAAAIALVMSVHYMKWERAERFEYPILMLLAVLGMMVMISARDLIAMYMGLELQSLALYVLAAMHRESGRSAEAGLKYFVLGAVASGLMLYGSSLVYGFVGATGFEAIAAAFKAGAPHLGAIIGLVFILAGLAFKISAVPFHMWTPDVYQGAPTPVTAFFAAAPKIAAMTLIMRVLYEGFPGAAEQWRQVLSFMAIASMLLGGFAGIAQTNIKRLLAYSSIGHMGFALIGLIAGGPEGLRATVFYLVIYMLLSLGTFAVVIAMRRDERPVEDIADFAGLARTNPALAFALAAMMFALAGIPPLAGFFAKYFVLLAAVRADLIALAVIGVLASVVSAVYYLNVVKVIYMDEPRGEVAPMPFELKLVAGLAVIFALAFVVWPRPLIELAQAAIRPLL